MLHSSILPVQIAADQPLALLLPSEVVLFHWRVRKLYPTSPVYIMDKEQWSMFMAMLLLLEILEFWENIFSARPEPVTGSSSI